MILTMYDDSTFKRLITDLAKRFLDSITDDMLYSNCTQCGRELEDETSRIIGRGPICRKGERIRFTVLPAAWPQTKKVVMPLEDNDDEWEEKEVWVDHPDLLSTMDEQADELDLDFILVAGREDHCLYLRQKKPPFNWLNMTTIGEIDSMTILLQEGLEMRTLLLLDCHEYVPHTLIRHEKYAAGVWPNERNMWNCMVMLTTPQGLWLRRRDACAPSYDHWEEIDDPVCNGCKEWYRETYDGGTQPGLRFLKDRFNECPKCPRISYDNDDELVYLGDLTIEDMLRGDGEISNPYHPGHPDMLFGVTKLTDLLRYSVFQEAMAWDISGGSIDWDNHNEFTHYGAWGDCDPREDFPSSLSTHETRIWTRICETISDNCIYGSRRMRTEWSQAMGESLSWRDRVHENLVERIPNLLGLYQFNMIWWMIPDYGITDFQLAVDPIYDINGNLVYRPDLWDGIIWAYIEMSLEQFKDRIVDGNEAILGKKPSPTILDVYGKRWLPC
jgi:hypothetical protein